MARATHPHDRAVCLDETPYPGPHPALKARKGGSLVNERLQKDGLGHPDGVGIFGDNVLEGKLAGGCAIAVGLVNSIMFPTIFTITLERSTASAAATSGLLCMAIIGGALLPRVAGLIADASTLRGTGSHGTRRAPAQAPG